MMSYRALVPAIAALLLAVGAVTAGCGDGADPAIEEYFDQVEQMIGTLDDRSAAQTIDFPNQAFAAWVTVLSETEDGLNAVEPPPEVADAHQKLADAMGEAAAALQELADQHPDVQSLEEAASLRDEDEAGWAADRRAREACVELREFARENGVDVSLELC